MKTLLAFLLTAFFAIGLVACDDGEAENAGEKVDQAMEDAGDNIEDAAEDTGDAIEDACDEATDGNC